MRIHPLTGIVLASACLAAADARAQTIQLAPFAGYQFGGSFSSPALQASLSLESGLDYGGTMDIAISKTWRAELLYSRQETQIGLDAPGANSFDLTVERYMAGVMEERGENKSRFFGVALAGVTRFVPGLPGFDTNSHFTLGVGLGLKHFFSDHIGLRGEVRGFYTFTDTNGGVFCAGGTCLFLFSGSGLWQGDVAGGLILAF